MCASFIAKAEKAPSVEYKLRFVEDFKGKKLNTKLWKRIPAGSPDWCKNMSLREDLVSVGNGMLTLYGIKNDGRDPTDKRAASDRRAIQERRCDLRLLSRGTP